MPSGPFLVKKCSSPLILPHFQKYGSQLEKITANKKCFKANWNSLTPHICYEMTRFPFF